MKSKAQMMWEVGKEAEAQFRMEIKGNLHSEDELEELFKLIRGSEYRRGKEDGIKEHEKWLEGKE